MSLIPSAPGPGLSLPQQERPPLPKLWMPLVEGYEGWKKWTGGDNRLARDSDGEVES